MADFAELVRERAPILTDGGIETRVMFETDYPMDPHVQVAAMAGDPEGRPLLWQIYAGYVEAARRHRLPVVIGTPTFRASLNFAERAGLDGDEAVRQLNADAVGLHREICAASDHPLVFIAGVIGPSGDAYTPEEAPDSAAAEGYHRLQAETLAGLDADFLFAPTFPALGEAIGASRAMAATGLPYVISYALGADGALLDGTPLADTIERLDAVVDPAPLMHSISCVHPSVAERAVEEIRARRPEALPRLGELKANGSPLPTTELIELDHPEADPPERFAAEVWGLHEAGGLHVLGGCCGTTDLHMRELARLIAK